MKRPVVIALGAFALLAAGCGGSGVASEPEPAPIAEVTQMICDEALTDYHMFVDEGNMPIPVFEERYPGAIDLLQDCDEQGAYAQ